MGKDNKSDVKTTTVPAPKGQVRQAMLTGFVSLKGSIAFFQGTDLVPSLLPEDYSSLDEKQQQAAMNKATALATKAGEERKAEHNAKVDALAAKGQVFSASVEVVTGDGSKVTLSGALGWNKAKTGLRACIQLPLAVVVSTTEGKVKAQDRGGYIPL